MFDKEYNKHKETSSVYYNKVKENSSNTSEKKEKARDGYLCIYEWGKDLFYSTCECVCAAKETTVIKMK